MVAVVLVVLAIVRRDEHGRGGDRRVVGVLVTTGAAYVTGRLLPWDQLALSAVTRRSDFPSAST